MPSAHFIVSGRVQGVGFRYAVKGMAEQLAVSGWVRNLPNGAVEVMARGDPKRLAELEAWLWKGPEPARVREVVTTPNPDPNPDPPPPAADANEPRPRDFYIRV